MTEVINDDQLLVDCHSCGCEVEEGDTVVSELDDNEYCQDCHGEHFFYCEQCGSEADYDSSMEVEGQLICETCSYDTVCCYGCDEYVFSDNAYYSDRDDTHYCESCWDGRERTEDYEWDVFSNELVRINTDFVTPSRNRYHMVNGVCVRLEDTYANATDSFDLIPSQRYQGVEIEFNTRYDTERSEIRRTLRHDIIADRLMSDNDYEIEEVRSCIRLDSDGSVTGENHRYGHEAIMSPRRGDVLYNDFKTVTKSLKSKHYGYISHRCGYHLHIDTRDYDWYHFMVLVAMTKLIEPHIYAFLPASRRTSNWCKPVSQSWQSFRDVDNRESFMYFYYDYTSYTSSKYNDKRYHGLNLHSHFQANQGTELRYHSGTLNPTKMLHWSILWSQIIDRCYDIAEQSYQQYYLSNSQNPRSWLWDNILCHLNRVSDGIEFEQYGFENFTEANDYYCSKYHWSQEEPIDYDEYYQDSIRLAKMLNIDNPTSGCYSILHLGSQLGFNMGVPHTSIPCMTKSGMYRLFDIPTTTQQFYNDMLVDRLSNDDTPDNHLFNCFRPIDRFVDYDDELHKFINVDFLTNRFKIVSAEPLTLKATQSGRVWDETTGHQLNSFNSYADENRDYI